MIDWDQVMSKAIMGGVIGGAVGGILGLVAYLNRKSGGREESQWEARERARIQAQMSPKGHSANTVPVWFFLVAIVAVVVGILAANPALIDRVLPR